MMKVHGCHDNGGDNDDNGGDEDDDDEDKDDDGLQLLGGELKCYHTKLMMKLHGCHDGGAALK